MLQPLRSHSLEGLAGDSIRLYEGVVAELREGDVRHHSENLVGDQCVICQGYVCSCDKYCHSDQKADDHEAPPDHFTNHRGCEFDCVASLNEHPGASEMPDASIGKVWAAAGFADTTLS